MDVHLRCFDDSSLIWNSSGKQKSLKCVSNLEKPLKAKASFSPFKVFKRLCKGLFKGL